MKYVDRISARDLRRIKKALVLRAVLRKQKADRRFSAATKKGGAE